jgi:repressor LexA
MTKEVGKLESMGERLRRLRENKNITQEQLGQVLNVKKSAISKYETNRVSMNIETIILLARYFSVPVTYLIESETDLIKMPGRIPLLGPVHTGSNLLAEENIEDFLDVPDYLSADFILKVSDEAMIGAGIMAGDLALCKIAPQPQTGQIIAVRKDTAEFFTEISLRYYLNQSGQPVLKSANPDHPDSFLQTDSITIIGKMVSLIRLEAPEYQTYTHYLTTHAKEEWMEVIETAADYGLSPQDILASVNLQAKLLKRLKTP